MGPFVTGIGFGLLFAAIALNDLTLYVVACIVFIISLILPN